MIATIQHVELPVTLSPGRRWSDEELFQFCRQNDDLQVERSACGKIKLMSPTGSAIGGGNAALTAQLYWWTRQDGRGKAFDSSTGWTLADGSMLSPDASWVSYERWNALTREQRRSFAPVCPEFVVELKSPSETPEEARAKMKIWLQNGAALAWLIDPDARWVEIFRPGREQEQLGGTDQIVADGPIAGFVLDLSLVWSE